MYTVIAQRREGEDHEAYSKPWEKSDTKKGKVIIKESPIRKYWTELNGHSGDYPSIRSNLIRIVV